MKQVLHWHTPEGTPSEKPPVVFLHGFLGRGADWNDVTDRLGADFQCLCPDLPGHGKSVGLDPSEYGFEQAAEDLMLDLHVQGIEQCALVGYSMGGRLALHLALHYPDRFPRVVLESASPGLKADDQRLHRMQHDGALAAELERIAEADDGFEEFLREWYAMPLWETLSAQPELLAAQIRSRLDGDPRELAKALRGLGTGSQPDCWPRLEELHAPTLLITGERDQKFGGIAQEIGERAERSAHHVMADCGHNVHLENTKGYCALLRQFLLNSAVGGG